MKKVLNQLETELRDTDAGIDSTIQFSPLCWLITSASSYANDIVSFTALEENTPYSILLEMLTKKISAMTEIGGPKPPDVKFVLLLCELIRLCPYHKTNPSVNIQLTDLMTLRNATTLDLGAYKEMIVEAVDSVIVLCVVSGSNPVPGLFMNQLGNNDVIGLLKSLTVGVHNISAFRCMLGTITPIIVSLPPDLRPEFCEMFYSVIGNFFVDHPTFHHEMLALTVNQAQIVIDSILSWSSTPEFYALPVICSLLPFINDVKDIYTKNHRYYGIINTLLNTKFKKGSNNFAAFAFLELYCANTHVLNEKRKDSFSSLSEFLRKNLEKFEKVVFNTKERMLVDKLFTCFLPRYAAVDFANKGSKEIVTNLTPSLDYLFSMADNGTGWTPISKFFTLVSMGYPLLNTSVVFPPKYFTQMCVKLNDCLQILAIGISEKDRLKETSSVVESIIEFISAGTYSNIVQIISLLRSDPHKMIDTHPVLKSFLEVNKDPTIMGSFCRASIGCIVNGPHCVVKDIIPFLIMSIGNGTFWSSYPLKDVFKLVHDLSVTFRSSITDALSKNSQNLSNLPALFLCYLRWADGILSKTNKNEKSSSFPSDFSSNLITSFLLLLGSCGSSPHIDICGSIINRILVPYGFNTIPLYPFDGIPLGDSTISTPIKAILNAWFGYVQRALNLNHAGIMLPCVTEKLPVFDPSRERIAKMTSFVCRFVDDSSVIANGKNIGPTAEHFFDAVFSYVGVSRGRDASFGDCFSIIHPTGLQFFEAALKKSVFQKYSESRFDKPFYWLNIIDIIGGRAKSPTLSAASFALLEETLPICLSFLQFGLFDNLRPLFIDSITDLINALYSKSHQKSHRYQSSTLLTIFESLLAISDSKTQYYSEENIAKLIQTLPILLKDYRFDISQTYPRAPDVIVERRLTMDMFFALHVFNQIVSSLQAPEIVNPIHRCLLEILAANTGSAWQHYIIVAQTAEPILKIAIVEAFTELLGMKYSVVSKIDKSVSKQIKSIKTSKATLKTVKTTLSIAAPVGSIKSGMKNNFGSARNLEMLKDQTSDASEKTSPSHGDLSQLETLLLYSRSIRSPIKVSFQDKDVKKLIEELIDNDFEFFTNPPCDKIPFLSAAVSCVGAAMRLEELFDSMTSRFIASKASVTSNNEFARFYSAFFMTMSSGWKLVSSLRHANFNSIPTFVDSLNPPAIFAYFLVRFHKMVNNIESTKKMLGYCFILPFLKCPMDYGIPGRIRNLNHLQFVETCMVNPAYDRMMEGILLSEPIFTGYTPANIDSDREVLMCYIGKNHSARFIPSSLESDAQAIAPQLLQIYQSNWIVPAGKLQNGANLFLVRLSLIPNVVVAAILSSFLMTIPNDSTMIQFVIVVDNIAPFLSELITKFIEGLPNGFENRVEKVFLVNIGIMSVPTLSKIDFSSFSSKIVPLDNVLDQFKNESNVYLPPWAYEYQMESRAYADVITPSGAKAQLIVCNTSFIIKGTAKLTDNNISTYICIPFTSIIELEDSKENNSDYLNIKFKEGESTKNVKLKTLASKCFKKAYDNMSLHVNFLPPCQAADVDIKEAKRLKEECVALSLHLLSLDRKYYVAPSLHLFEAAIRPCSHSPDIVIPVTPHVPFTYLFNEIEKENLVSLVVPRLTSYFRFGPATSCVSLLPLIVSYLEKSTERGQLTRVLNDIISISADPIVLSYLNQFLWSKVKSTLAIELLTPILLRSDIPSKGMGCVFRTISENFPDLIGDLLINKMLDGVIRRRSFDNGIKPEKVFSVLRTLSFELPEVVTNRIAPLVFGCVFGAVHADQEVVDDIRIIITATVRNICKMNPEKETDLIAQNLYIQNLLKRPRDMSVSALMTAGDNLCGCIGENEKQSYRSYISNQSACENPSMWYIKASSMVQMGNTDKAFIQKFISIMSQLFDSPLGHLRLELCLATLSSLMDLVPDTSYEPVFLFWPSLYASSHPNTHLRLSGLMLLEKTIQFCGRNGGFRNINGIESSAFITQGLTDSLALFRDGFKGDMSQNFTYLLVAALTRGFEEIDTRNQAGVVAKLCMKSLASRPFMASHYLLPFIAYPDEDIVSIASIFSQKKTVTEIIFDSFEQRREIDQMFIAGYLTSVWVDRFSAQNSRIIADCLIAGASKYPHVFRPAMNSVVSKAWRITDSESRMESVDIAATVSAHFLSIPDTGVDLTDLFKKFEFKRISDEKLNKIIRKSLSGVKTALTLV